MEADVIGPSPATGNSACGLWSPDPERDLKTNSNACWFGFSIHYIKQLLLACLKPSLLNADSGLRNVVEEAGEMSSTKHMGLGIATIFNWA